MVKDGVISRPCECVGPVIAWLEAACAGKGGVR